MLYLLVYLGIANLVALVIAMSGASKLKGSLGVANFVLLPLLVGFFEPMAPARESLSNLVGGSDSVVVVVGTYFIGAAMTTVILGHLMKRLRFTQGLGAGLTRLTLKMMGFLGKIPLYPGLKLGSLMGGKRKRKPAGGSSYTAPPPRYYGG